MKKESILINTARGSIIKTEDLIYALENDYIKGAALDVFEEVTRVDELNSFADDISLEAETEEEIEDEIEEEIERDTSQKEAELEPERRRRFSRRR